MFILFDLELRIDHSRISWLIETWGLEYIEFGGFGLLWQADVSCAVRVAESTLSVREVRQEASGDTQLACLKVWSGRALVSRNWPGIQAVYVRATKYLIVTTHLRLWAACGFGKMAMPKAINAGSQVQFVRSGARYEIESKLEMTWPDCEESSFEETASDLLEKVRTAVAQNANDSIVLLSGGIDSAAMAISAPLRPCITWMTSYAAHTPTSKSDSTSAARLASAIPLVHEQLALDGEDLARNLAAAILLSETRRGTFVDDAVVYVQMARELSKRGITRVLIGEAADDVLGCMNHYLHYYKGDELRAVLRKTMIEGAPNDYASICRIFGFFGISAVDPYLELRVARLGYALPLSFRIDARRLMKPLLRRAFAGVLPNDVVERPKVVSRDASGVKAIMSEKFGKSRERYVEPYRRLFREEQAHLFQNETIESLRH